MTNMFNADGSFKIALELILGCEGWQKRPEGYCYSCIPHDGTADATYTYDAGAE
jgi:hypothetical protein